VLPPEFRYPLHRGAARARWVIGGHRKTVPEPLERLLSKCLARSAADRPRSAGEVRDALDQLCEAV
jgi:hypothetical protein